MKTILLFFTGLLISFQLISQVNPVQYNKAVQQLNRRGEVYFSFQLKSPADIQNLTNIISIDNVKGGKVFAYANAREFPKFIEYNTEFEVLTAPSELEPVPVTDDPQQVLDWNYYPTYDAYEAIMTQFVTDHPGIARLITIGALASGRKLLALKITDNPDVQENEPEFLYTSSIHGDETTGYILMLHLIDYLLTNYGSDDRITNLVNSTEIYINPLANPDGTYKGGNSTVNGATRGNANNVDLNRNYADPQAGPHPDGNPWQPETVAFMGFAGFHHITMSANFHGGEEVVNYPWDTWSRLTADNNWWVFVSREYADTVHAHAPSNYMHDFDNGITNGYAWYTITGGRQDYMNFFRNCREVTIEISSTKLLPTSQLINHWNYNYRSFLDYLEESNYGLNGIVTDSLTGGPLMARVYISGHDIDSSHVFTDPSVGDYHRLLKAGTYNVTFSSAGYIPKTISVSINDRVKTIQDVQLYDGSLKSNFTCDSTIIPVGGNVHFVDQSAGIPLTWHWEFEGGLPATSAEPNPTVSYQLPGKYNVKLVVTRTGAIDSIIKQQYIDVKQWYLMSNESYQVCDAILFDSGGSAGNYSANESHTMTFSPSTPGKKLKATFISFRLENSVDCSNDFLKVYDGNSTASPLLGTYCGSDIPPVLLASNAAGALTFEFQSNNAIEESGWEALLECDSNVGYNELGSTSFKMYPNPVTNGLFHIKANAVIQKLSVIDELGNEIIQEFPGRTELTIKAPSHIGIYFVRLQIGNKLYSQKLMVTARP
jgi:PKD repeat protein